MAKTPENPFYPYEARIIHQGDSNTPTEILLLKEEKVITMTPQKMLGWISRERFRAETGRTVGSLSMLAGMGLFGWQALSYFSGGEVHTSTWGFIGVLELGGIVLTDRSNELRNKVLAVKATLSSVINPPSN